MTWEQIVGLALGFALVGTVLGWLWERRNYRQPLGYLTAVALFLAAVTGTIAYYNAPRVYEVEVVIWKGGERPGLVPFATVTVEPERAVERQGKNYARSIQSGLGQLFHIRGDRTPNGQVTFTAHDGGLTNAKTLNFGEDLHPKISIVLESAQ